jgi:hypothetical protein
VQAVAGALSRATRSRRPRVREIDWDRTIRANLRHYDVERRMVKRAAALVHSGVNVVCLLVLSDRGAPSYDQRHAAAFAALGIPAFACTLDLFPELMAAAIHRRDLNAWTAQHDIPAARG